MKSSTHRPPSPWGPAALQQFRGTDLQLPTASHIAGPVEPMALGQVQEPVHVMLVQTLDERQGPIPPNDILLRHCVLCSFPRQADGRRRAVGDAWDRLPEPIGQSTEDRVCLLARRGAVVLNVVAVRVQTHVLELLNVRPVDDEVQALLPRVRVQSRQEPQLELHDALTNYLLALWVAREVAPPIKTAVVREVQRRLEDSHCAVGPALARSLLPEIGQHLVSVA